MLVLVLSVRLHLRGHLKSEGAQQLNFSGASRRTDAPTINGVYRSTIKQRWAIILPPPKRPVGWGVKLKLSSLTHSLTHVALLFRDL